MSYITVGKENGADIQIYYKDWGSGHPIVFSDGWPPSADDLPTTEAATINADLLAFVKS